MNIFILDEDPLVAAKMHCDSHIVKMITECAQMLSTNYRIAKGTEGKKKSKSGKTMIRHWFLEDTELEDWLFVTAHYNHPCTKWARISSGNWDWLYQLYVHLSNEYYHYFGKFHKSSIFVEFFERCPDGIPKGPRTDFCIAMDLYPHCIVRGDPVQSYKNYYIDQKLSFATYKNRAVPDFLKPYLEH